MRKIRILFCDDEKQIRDTYRELIPKTWEKYIKTPIDFQDCEDIVEANPLYNQLSTKDVGTFDLLLLDIVWKINRKEISRGIEIAKTVKQECPELPIIVFSDKVKIEDFKDLIPIGISGYLSKGDLDAKGWCIEIDNVLRRTYEDRSGQPLYKQIREILAGNTAWNAHVINEAASEVWRQENDHGKWIGFWEILTNTLAMKKIIDPFEGMTESFKNMDLVTLGVLPTNKGHLEHVLYVYFTGYVIIEKVPLIKTILMDSLKNLMGANYDDTKQDNYWELFQFAWLACATLHDVGYCLEVLPDILAKYQEITQQFDFALISGKSEAMTCDSLNFSDEKGKFAKEAFELIIGRLHQNTIPIDWIISNTVYKDKKNINKFNHGIASGVLFLQKIYSWKKLLEKNDDLLIFLKWAATAMALHSLKYVGEKDNIALNLKKDPLSFLLILCDELQIWNRERPDANEKSDNFKSINLDFLNVESNRIQAAIKYIPFAGKVLTKKEHINPLSTSISKDSLTLAKFLNAFPLSIEIKSSIQGVEESLPTIEIN